MAAPMKLLKNPRVVVVLGCTGSGKSKLALDIAGKYSAEIISADSMQRGPIGVARLVKNRQGNLILEELRNEALTYPTDLQGSYVGRHRPPPYAKNALANGLDNVYKQ